MDLQDRSQHRPGYAAQEKEGKHYRGTAGDTGRGPIPGPGAEDRIKPAGRQKQDHYPAAVL